ncbi:hypothetical protein PCANC_04608 [Puccinia coronata f. sp. avenae]|uniref:Uncharacterized protein n=1 Tax=Puccinia coronata f. sp. avenae TaxID=200324 RepID=A0A2N5W0B9_9BASI|nr:hypothetical protein PCANC_04608 [Puccinia coronata f. sp. avenae]
MPLPLLVALPTPANHQTPLERPPELPCQALEQSNPTPHPSLSFQTLRHYLAATAA